MQRKNAKVKHLAFRLALWFLRHRENTVSIAPEIDKYTKGGNVRIKLRAVWDGRLIRVKYLDEMCATVFSVLHRGG